jgi:glycerol-3-phosphate dehydrogenase (NAD(P)+)
MDDPLLLEALAQPRGGGGIGRGKHLSEVLAGMKMVAEGVWTAKALFGPEADLGEVQMPIAEQVHAVLFDGKNPRDAVARLDERRADGGYGRTVR